MTLILLGIAAIEHGAKSLNTGSLITKHNPRIFIDHQGEAIHQIIKHNARFIVYHQAVASVTQSCYGMHSREDGWMCRIITQWIYLRHWLYLNHELNLKSCLMSESISHFIWSPLKPWLSLIVLYEWVIDSKKDRTSCINQLIVIAPSLSVRAACIVKQYLLCHCFVYLDATIIYLPLYLCPCGDFFYPSSLPLHYHLVLSDWTNSGSSPNTHMCHLHCHQLWMTLTQLWMMS